MTTDVTRPAPSLRAATAGTDVGDPVPHTGHSTSWNAVTTLIAIHPARTWSTAQTQGRAGLCPSRRGPGRRSVTVGHTDVLSSLASAAAKLWRFTRQP